MEYFKDRNSMPVDVEDDGESDWEPDEFLCDFVYGYKLLLLFFSFFIVSVLFFLYC